VAPAFLHKNEKEINGEDYEKKIKAGFRHKHN
jgi:hypothetical protein